jgi:hypothetical protein
MTWNKTSSASGRQLLSVTARLASDTAPGDREALWRKKIRILLDLNNPGSALEAAGEFHREFPGQASPELVLADVFSRLGRWREALARFESARDILVRGGNGPAARKLDLGPVFRLNEALGNAAACLRLTEGHEALAAVLKARTWRRAGTASALTWSAPDDPVAGNLLKLERAWRGEGIRTLPEVVDEWGKAEPEWRWRVLVEGISLFRDAHMPITPWKKLQAELSRGMVLDPRFGAERRATSALFSKKAQAAT